MLMINKYILQKKKKNKKKAIECKSLLRQILLHQRNELVLIWFSFKKPSLADMQNHEAKID